jgi:hypothetical protein
MICGSGESHEHKEHLENGDSAAFKHAPSTSRTMLGARFAKRYLASVPSLDLRSQPEAWPPAPKVQDRSRHIRIAPHV